MEPALPLPLRLQLSHAAVPMEHDQVSDSIAAFLTSYAARTGTNNIASSSAAAEDPTSNGGGSGSTGGVVAAQLTRLMNGLAGRIDYDAFTNLISGLNNTTHNSNSSNGAASSHTTFQEDDDDVDMQQQEEETPVELLEPSSSVSISATTTTNADADGKQSFSQTDELQSTTSTSIDSPPTIHPTPTQDVDEHLQSPSKKSKKGKKESKKDSKKEKKLKKEAA